MEMFKNITKGDMVKNDVFDEIRGLIQSVGEADSRLFVGSDSQAGGKETCFVTVIVLHHVGKGAKFYYAKSFDRKDLSMKERMWKETVSSLELANELTEYLADNGVFAVPLEVHVDIGYYGKSKGLIKEIMGAVVASGFEPKIKPDAYAAQTVADKFSKFRSSNK